MQHLFLSLILLLPGTIAAEPVMRLAEGTISLGDVTEGTTLTDSVKVVNAGDEPLVIRSVSSDCGCTAADYPTDPLEPGAEGWIKVKFKSNRMAPGKVRKTLRIRSNSKGSGRDILFVEAMIRRRDANLPRD